VRLLPKIFAAGVLLIGCFLAPGAARAFCRTTTTSPPAGYDPVKSGCWTEGKPIAWTAGRVPYGMSSAASKYVTLSEASRVADLAFAAWNSAPCASGPPVAQGYDVGPLDVQPDSGDCTASSTCNASTHDVIVFRDQVWPYDDPSNILALTTVVYGVQNGEIFEAYTEVNTAEHPVTTETPPTNGAFELQPILTHEAGHFLGLAHATNTHSIMYAYYQAGVVNLTPDDVAAICAVYDPPPPTSDGSACQASPARTGASAATVFGLLACLVAFRRRAGRT
jgi:hypothetical protein